MAVGRPAGWLAVLLGSRTLGGEPPGACTPVSSSCMLASWQAACAGDPSGWLWPVADSSWKGSCPTSPTGEEPCRRPENCSGTCPSCPSVESWLRLLPLRLWSGSGRRERNKKLNVAKINKVPTQRAHGRAEEFKNRGKERDAGWAGERVGRGRGEREEGRKQFGIVLNVQFVPKVRAFMKFQTLA